MFFLYPKKKICMFFLLKKNLIYVYIFLLKIKWKLRKIKFFILSLSMVTNPVFQVKC